MTLRSPDNVLATIYDNVRGQAWSFKRDAAGWSH